MEEAYCRRARCGLGGKACWGANRVGARREAAVIVYARRKARDACFGPINNSSFPVVELRVAPGVRRGRPLRVIFVYIVQDAVNLGIGV